MYKITSVFVFLYLALSVAYSEQPIDSVVNRMGDQSSARTSELIYLQTSKDIYETGEDLWFKAYQMNAQTFELSDKSKTLYLQMINSADSVVWQEKYLIENGVASGHVYIDEKLAEGDYSLHSYTRHSFHQNDTTGVVSARKIKVVKKITHISPPQASKESTFRFEMFPEGGNLVAEIPARLAFKATDSKGIPTFVEGTIYQDNEPLSKLKSVHDGMGSILFTPLKDKTYKIELSNGKSYSLPTIHTEGMALRLIKQDKRQLSFIVSKSGNLLNQQIYLVGQMRGMVCCVAKGILRDILRISIATENFPHQGIAEFTLFDSAMQPLAERLVYLHSDKRLNIELTPEKDNFAIREKGTIKIKVTDTDGNPVRANLGISIYDKAYSEPSNSANILTHCYLFSQIRGKIYNPSYYFDEKNKDKEEGMELLLLTQGWRRYIWNFSSTAYKGKPFLTDEINGTQTIPSKKRAEQNQSTEQLIQVFGAAGSSLFTWADSSGHFIVSTDMMKELRGGYVYLKPMLPSEFKPRVEIADYFSLIDSTRIRREYYYPAIDFSQTQKKVEFEYPMVSSDSAIFLNEVTIMAKGRKPFRDKMMGRLDSLAQVKLGPWVCKHGWLENYKEGYTHHHDPRYVPNVVDDGEPRTAPVIGKQYTIMKAEYYPCGAKGFWCFKPLDRRTIIYQGMLYTEEELLLMNNLWRTKGYYATREFYQPDETYIQSSIPDVRNTLLWSPSVITDEKGEAQVSFYCSDLNTNFIGVVEGVDGEGLLGTTKCEFRVLKK